MTGKWGAHTHRKHAFTLVELLVVMAIISVLAALLLPALERAIDTAQASYCANNLRQLGIAVNNYTLSNDEYIPYYYTRGQTEPDGYPAYYMLIKNGDLEASIQTMFGTTYWVSALLQCPAALGLEPTWPGNVPAEYFTTGLSRNDLTGTIALNYPASPRGKTSADSNAGEVRRTIFHYGVNGMGAGNGPFTCDLIWPDIFCPMSRMAKMRNPSDCWLAGDCYESALTKPVYRHLERASFLYFDGHAAHHSIRAIDYVYSGTDFRVFDNRQLLAP